MPKLLQFRWRHKAFSVCGIALLSVACQPPAAEEPAAPEKATPVFKLTDTQRATIDELTGAAGVYSAEEDVHKVTFPRTEAPVTVDGWPFQPFMGITSWAAFTPIPGGQLMVMGDLTLFEDEVNAVMSVALDNGLEVTALHNHFFFDNPRVMFMHIGGYGSAETLASAVRKAIDKVKEIRAAVPQPAFGFPGERIPDKSSLSAEAIDRILNVKGSVNNGMYKAVIGRTAKMHGREVGGQMGVNTWAAFAGSDKSAFVDGDFAVREDELQAVLKALRGAGINIVAIHNHMIHDEPRYVFLHYWGKGSANSLAQGIKTTLDVLGPP